MIHDPLAGTRLAVNSILFPGINLHSRDRYRRVPEKFGAEVSAGTYVLDAGCGNGMLSYQAWRRGATVLGISIKQKEVDGCRSMFNLRRKIPEASLRFENINLYELRPETRRFDAIICTEVLEHIRDDHRICAKFFELLKPGGRLHITTPNADHPYNGAFPLDEHEQGGHVRAGYTGQSYRELLEPIGFALEEISGLGGPIRQAFNHRIKSVQERFGAAAGLPMFVAALPLVRLDPSVPPLPFSLYARARKRS